MRKHLRRTLVMILAAVIIGGSAPAAGLGGLAGWLSVTAAAKSVSGTCGENVNWSLDSSTGLLTVSGSGAMADYTQETDVPWYSSRESVKTVKISDGVTDIGENAFQWCESLTSVTIPESVTSIGSSAFEFCSNLSSVTIPESVTEIGNYAFEFCTALTSVTVPQSVKNVGMEAFGQVCNVAYSGTVYGSPWGAKSLNGFVEGPLVYDSASKNTLRVCSGSVQGYVTVDSSVTGIGECAFESCAGLTGVKLGDKVTSIGDYAFEFCKNLTVVTVPNSVASIGRNAFFGCSALTDVTLGKNVQSIGECAFENCPALADVNIPDNVSTIGEEAFFGCTGLTSVTIPDSVLTVGDGAFGLVCNIVYSGSAAGAPFGARSLNGFVDGFLVYDSAEKKVLKACSSTVKGNVTVPDSVAEIGENAFSRCSELTGVTIPASVSSIGKYAFDSCASLETVTLPDSITSVSDCAFYACSGLTEVNLPGSVTRIGSHAFNGCVKLEKVTLPRSVESIGDHAFCFCTSLIYANIPESVKTVGEDAFYMACNIIYNGTAAGAPFGARSLNGFVDGFTVYDSAAKTVLKACSGSVQGSVIIPEGVKKIDSHAFDGCEKLTSVSVPESVTSIGDSAFALCTSLSGITIPENVTSIGDGAFDSCVSLTNIDVPASVRSIGEDAFYECEKLAYICCDTEDCSAKEYAEANGILFRVCNGHLHQSTVTVRDYVPSATVDYKTTITFTADVENGTADGEVHWFIDGKDVGTGDTYTVSKAKKSFTLQVSYVSEGKVLTESEIETVNVRTDIFSRIKAFFRTIFGTLPKVVQGCLTVDELI